MTDLERREFLAAAGAFAVVSLMPSSLPAAPARRGAPLNIALVGAGRQGSAALVEITKLDAAKVIAVCDTDQGRADRAVRRTQGAAGYTNLAEMLDKSKDINAVIIATPTHEHKVAAETCLSAGKHVYCETPIAHTRDDVLAIHKAATAAKSIFASALEGRSNPIYKLSRGFYRSDSVRDLISMRAQSHQKTTWRVPSSDPAREAALNWRLDKSISTGLAGELGVHQFDVIHWFKNDYPASVRGYGSLRFHKDGREVPDTVHCDLFFADGPLLSWDATLANSFQGKHEIFCGSNAAIKLAWTAGWMFKEADAPQQGWEVYANRQQFHNDEGITLIADATKLASQGKLKEGVGLPNPPLYYALADFIKSITEGQPPVASAADGARATLVALAAHEAVTTGKEVTIDPAMLRSL
ncbi:MAG: Gfo/Idh/MocA family oxidoreductase [Phycisphaerales bacterium]|jgi:predicted dehydrogenase